MPSKKPVKKAAGNRQAAYSARNRAALIKAGQEVLAEIGPGATIEQLASHAQVSPTTVYKYFASKELLFSEALDQIWREWVVWSYNGVQPGQSLQATLDTARKLFWVKQTHPFFAKILHNTLGNPTFLIEAVRGGGTEVFKKMADKGELKKDDFEKQTEVTIENENNKTRLAIWTFSSDNNNIVWFLWCIFEVNNQK